MVILFSTKEFTTETKWTFFRWRAPLPGFPLSTFFPAFTELQVAPRELETAGFKRPLSSRPRRTQRGCPQLVTIAPTPTPGHCPRLHMPVIKPSPVFLVFHITPQIFTLKKICIQFAKYIELILFVEYLEKCRSNYRHNICLIFMCGF